MSTNTMTTSSLISLSFDSFYLIEPSKLEQHCDEMVKYAKQFKILQDRLHDVKVTINDAVLNDNKDYIGTSYNDLLRNYNKDVMSIVEKINKLKNDVYNSSMEERQRVIDKYISKAKSIEKNLLLKKQKTEENIVKNVINKKLDIINQQNMFFSYITNPYNVESELATIRNDLNKLNDLRKRDYN